MLWALLLGGWVPTIVASQRLRQSVVPEGVHADGWGLTAQGPGQTGAGDVDTNTPDRLAAARSGADHAEGLAAVGPIWPSSHAQAGNAMLAVHDARASAAELLENVCGEHISPLPVFLCGAHSYGCMP